MLEGVARVGWRFLDHMRDTRGSYEDVVGVGGRRRVADESAVCVRLGVRFVDAERVAEVPVSVEVMAPEIDIVVEALVVEVDVVVIC